MKNIRLSRRDFVAKSSLATVGMVAAPYIMANATDLPGNRIQLGFIGVGKQSHHLLRELMKCPETVVMACSDVSTVNLEMFREVAQQLNNGKYDSKPEVTAYADFREVIARNDIDAIVIASPDHWHGIMVVETLKSGKDVYCEKPLAATIVEGRAMVDATNKYKRVFQTGNMQRSWEEFRHGCELVRNGYIGEIKEIKVNIGGPYRMFDLPVEETPSEIDWDMWIGPAMYRGYHHSLAPIYKPGENMVFPKWRDYKPYGGGGITDWGAHMFDIAQWGIGMDGSAPVKYMPPRGGGATTGLQMVYDNGIVMSHEDWGHGGVRFIGTEGKLDVSRGYLKSDPESVVEQKIKDAEIRLAHSENHYQNWIDSIKSRNQPICDVTVGHSTSALCNVVNIAYELERDLVWDPKMEKFLNDDDANKLLSRPYRGSWKLEG